MNIDYSKWEPEKDYPSWMNEVSLATISKGYLLPDENPKRAYKRVADAETPDGVADWKELPWMKEFFKYKKQYPKDIEQL